jgi:hypothetical protein
VRSYLACHTGAENIANSNNDFCIYPNPSDGLFTMNIPSDRNELAKVIITDLLGKKIKEFAIKTNEPSEISLNLPGGFYLLTVINGCQKWEEKLLINQ